MPKVTIGNIAALSIRRAALLLSLLLLSPPPVQAVTMSWSPVGNAGNPANTTGYGGVGYAYNIGTYEVTNVQYAEFLNAKDSTGTNTLGLYASPMGTDATYGGIRFNSGSPDGSKYVVVSGHGSQPVNFVSWYDTLRFANWLNNGQGNGDTETGAYILGPLGVDGIPINGNSITRNVGARIFLSSEDEWYKAAYYNPASSSYFQYPTNSNAVPIAQAPPGDNNSANYNFGSSHLTDVGAYTSTISPYGEFDMGGNVWEWTEPVVNGSSRVVHGNSIAGDSHYLLASEFRGNPRIPSTYEHYDVGFRVASVASVPEPSTLPLAVAALPLLMFALRKTRNAFQTHR